MDRDVLAVSAVAVFEVVALGFAIGLWRGSAGVVSKLIWTAILVVPVLGVIAFVVAHDPPPPSDPIDRTAGRDWDGPTPPPGT